MEIVSKVGEIISEKGTFGNWIFEQLEKSDYVVRSHIITGFNIKIEIFEKNEKEQKNDN